MERFPVSEAKEKELEKRMLSLDLREEHLREEFIRGSGAGGQKINKTSVAVQLTDLNTGICVRCQESRSQSLNRYYARLRLVEKLEAIQLGKQSEQQQRIEKLKRQKRRRSRRAKEKMLDAKHHQGEKKDSRRKPSLD